MDEKTSTTCEIISSRFLLTFIIIIIKAGWLDNDGKTFNRFFNNSKSLIGVTLELENGLALDN